MKTLAATMAPAPDRHDGYLRRIMRFLVLSGAGYVPLMDEEKPQSPTVLGYGLYL